MTTSTRKATPLHAFVLATLVIAAGGITHLNQFLPSAGILSQVITRVSPTESSVEDTVVPSRQFEADEAQEQTPKETTAQKRARFAPLITAAAAASKVEPALIEAVMTAESAFNPFAISRTGAVGLMQLMPDTALRFGVTDRWDPAQNILGGAKYLYFLLHKFGSHKLAIAAYNAGEGNVQKHRNKVPPFAETRAYVPRVLAYYTKYSRES